MKKILKHLFNNSKFDGMPVQEQFRKIAEAIASQPAVITQGKTFTYEDIQRRSDDIEAYLKKAGAKPGDIVAVITDRSIHMVSAVMGILKAGCAFLPIDDNYPFQRIRFMLDNSDVKYVLSPRNILKKLSFRELLGLDNENIEPVVTSVRSQIDFDRLPLPDRTLIRYEDYVPYEKMSLCKDVITMQCTRGCPYQCLYCHNIWPKTHSIRSAENIFEEINLYYQAGIRRFSIVDDIFNLDRKNSARLFQMVIDHKLDVQFFFGNGIRGDILTKDYIDLMSEAGLTHLSLALETASPRLQKLLRKNINIDRFRENVEYILQQHSHILVDLFTMHGFPTETEDEAMMTLNFIKSMKWLNTPYVFVLKIFPNTKMFDFAVEHGVSREAIEHSINLAYHELPDTLPWPKSFTINYQTRVLNDYYLNKERILHILPREMAQLSEKEILNQYSIYLPQRFNTFDELLSFLKIDRNDLGDISFHPDTDYVWDGFSEKIKPHFPDHHPDDDAFRILLLDLSQLFTEDSYRHHDLIEPPLGLIYILTYLNQQLGSQINGRIVKSRIDFDNFYELKQLMDDFYPDMIGIRTLSHNADFFHYSVQLIRQWGFECPIIAGGPYATSSYRHILQDVNVSAVVMGEGEETFLDIIQRVIKNNRQWLTQDQLSMVEGLAYRPVNDAYSPKRLIIDLDHLPRDIPDREDVHVSSDQLAYCIYTSGSIGQPKGVLVEHRSLMALISAWRKVYGLDRFKPVVLQTATFAFDAFIGDMLKALLFQGTLIIADHKQRTLIKDLEDLCVRYNVNLFESTPSFMQQFLMRLSKNRNIALKVLIVGGEAAYPEIFNQIVSLSPPGSSVFNGYGLSETCIENIVYKGDRRRPISGSYSIIGKPISGTEAYILRTDRTEVADGESGELCLTGDCISREYLNLPGMTNEKYIRVIINNHNKRLFRTGDRARKNDQGLFEYLGRIDEQVQVRGHRVELAEIEHVLQAYPGISRVAVKAHVDFRGRTQIVAYYLSDEVLSQDQLDRDLRKQMPGFMVPGVTIRCQDFPLLPNGKVNKQLLPEPDLSVKTVDYMPPRNSLEEKMVSIWKEILRIDTIGIYDDFFDLGGDSLDSIRIVADMEKIGVRCTITDIYYYRNIHALSDYFSGQTETGKVIRDESEAIQVLHERLQCDIEYQKIESGGRRYRVLRVHHVKEESLKQEIIDMMSGCFPDELVPDYICFNQESPASDVDPSDDHIQHLLQGLREQEVIYSNQILERPVCQDYRNEPLSAAFRKVYRPLYFIEHIRINGVYNKELVNRTVRKLLTEQGVLKTVIIRDQEGFVWREFEAPERVSIPELDLSGYPLSFGWTFLTQALPRYYEHKDRLSAFPFRVLMVHMTLREHYLVYLMDEAIHDKAGADLFRRQFMDYYSNPGRNKVGIAPYRDYLVTIKQGPIGITPDEIISTYTLRDYTAEAERFSQQFLKNAKGKTRQYFFTYDLEKEKTLDQRWELSITVFREFFKQFFNVSTFPFAMVHDTRTFENGRYMNTIGEFMDLVPMMMSGDKDVALIGEDVHRRLNRASEHHIHFLSLYFSSGLKKAYPSVHQLLRSYVGDLYTSNKLVIFHYKTDFDTSIELYDDSLDQLLLPWLRGFYFFINPGPDQIHVLMNLPVDIDRQAMDRFFHKHIGYIIRKFNE